MASRPELIEFASREAMAARIADLIEARLDSGGALAVSGGSTPKTLYEGLASRKLPWSEIDVVLVDERWVNASHPRSNEAFVRKAFARANGAPITGLYNNANGPSDGVVDIATDLERIRIPFDAVILGMGDDGHTASWFPHAAGLETALSSNGMVCAVRAKRSDITGEEVDRMTLTLAAIKDAKVIVLLLAGTSKRATFEEALRDGPVEDMPVRAILRARPDLWVCWAP